MNLSYHVSSLLRMPSPKLAVREVQIPVPVVSSHVMFTRADVVSDGVSYRLVEPGHVVRATPAFAQQRVNGAGVDRGEKFAARIRTTVLFGAGDVQGPR